MGLFSGSFGTGLITGLATSVDKSLRNAMDKRDEEMSRARQFWQTRQAQKLDQKEAYDARAEKALRRMIKEAGDDVELGLVAFNAAGGDADSVEALIKRIDETRANKGTYNILDSLKDAEGNPIKPGGTSINLEDALKSVRQELKGVDAGNIKIDSPLENTMFKLKGGVAQKTAESINALIPPETVERITGIPIATLDMSNMLEAEKYAQNQKLIAKQLTPSLAEANASIVQDMMALDPTSDTFAADSAKLLTKQSTILSAMGQEAQAKDTGGAGSLTVSGLNTMYQNQLSAYLVAKGINTKEQAYIDEAGATVYADGKGYMAALTKYTKAFNTSFINTIKRDDGSFGPAAASLIGNNVNLQSIASGMAKADGDTTDASLDDVPEVPTIDWSKKSAVVADPAGFADHAYKTKPNITADKIYSILTRSGVAPEAASEQAERIHALQEAERVAAANAPKYVPGKGLVSPEDDDSNNVPPRYQGPGGYARKAKWDSIYGATHNPDGTPK